MKKTVLLWFVIAPAIVVACLLAIPSDRYLLRGLLRNESFEGGRPVSYWIAQLKDSDPEERTEAAVALGRIGEAAKEAAPALAADLADEDDLARKNVALALFKIAADDPDTVRALGEALTDPLPDVRMEAALALRRIGPAAAPALPALVRALQDASNRPLAGPFLASVAQTCATVLGRIGPPARDAIPVLAEIAVDSQNDPGLRREAAQALKKIDPDGSR